MGRGDLQHQEDVGTSIPTPPRYTSNQYKHLWQSGRKRMHNQKEPVCIGFPMVIMVNAKGLAMSMRAVEAIDIIEEAGKRKKK